VEWLPHNAECLHSADRSRRIQFPGVQGAELLSFPNLISNQLSHAHLVRYSRPILSPSHHSADIFGSERGLEDAGSAAATVYPVWFGTNRNPHRRRGVGSERHPRTTYGRAEVLIPEGDRFGETGSPFWKKLLRFDLRDDRLRLQRLTTEERADWANEVQQTMRDAKEGVDTPQARFLLHGFNASFEEAAIRAVQIGFDLRVPGATAFFSWPSRGSVTAYPVDEASIEAGGRSPISWWTSPPTAAPRRCMWSPTAWATAACCALQRIAANAETRGHVKFGQVVLATPGRRRSG
jgi:hypothetical protein